MRDGPVGILQFDLRLFPGETKRRPGPELLVRLTVFVQAHQRRWMPGRGILLPRRERADGSDESLLINLHAR